MRLYVLRHGKAKRDSKSGLDEDRELRARGRQQARWIGRRLAEMAPAPDRIVSSGFTRAIDTARIVEKILGAPLEVAPELEFGHEAEDVVARIPEWGAGCDSMLLVGHNPQLEGVLARLCPDTDAGARTLRTGEMAIVDVSVGAGGLKGVIVGAMRRDDEM